MLGAQAHLTRINAQGPLDLRKVYKVHPFLAVYGQERAALQPFLDLLPWG